MTPDLPTFSLLYPEFDAVEDTVVQFWIDKAIDKLLEEAWGLCYTEGTLAHAAHELALSLARQASVIDAASGDTVIGATGVITSASAEGLSVSFAQQKSASETDDGAFYAQTPYGQHFLALRRECLPRGRLVCQ